MARSSRDVSRALFADDDPLAFAGIAPAAALAIPPAAQFTEKLHAYSYSSPGLPDCGPPSLAATIHFLKRLDFLFRKTTVFRNIFKTMTTADLVFPNSVVFLDGKM